jgi:hypothetical protein
MDHLQAILFDKKKFNVYKAMQWLDENGYYPLKLHITDKYIRARLKEPNHYKYTYRTINLEKHVKATFLKKR